MLRWEHIKDICSNKAYTWQTALEEAQGKRVLFMGYKANHYTAEVSGHTARAVLHNKSDKLLEYDCGCTKKTAQRKPPCPHVIALLMYLVMYPEQQLHARNDAGKVLEFLHVLEPQQEVEATLEMELSIKTIYGKPTASLRVGEGRLYVVNDVLLLAKALSERRTLNFGKQFTLDGSLHQLSPPDRRVLALLAEILESQSPRDSYGTYSAYRHNADNRNVSLSTLHAERLLRLMSGRELVLDDRSANSRKVRVTRDKLPIQFKLTAQTDGLELITELPPGIRWVAEDCAFVAMPSPDNRILPVPSRFLGAMRMHLNSEGSDGRSRLYVPHQLAGRLVSEALPSIRDMGHVSIDEALSEKILQLPLDIRVYLDMQDGDVTAAVSFVYDEIIIDPFGPEPDIGERLIVRDAASERAVLNALERYGFTVRPGCARLEGDGALYAFCEQGVAALQALGDVYVSEAFTAMRPRKPAPRAKLTTSQGGMMYQLTLQLEGVDEESLQTVLDAMREKREWTRLANGAFITLPQDEAWHAIAEEAMEQDAENLSRTRAIALGVLANRAGLAVEMDDGAATLLSALGGPVTETDALKGVLRPYQLRGLEWLWSLYRLGLGGVLADDMGLGKTVQTLALIDKAREQDGPAASLIVAPTSLTYNWLKEAKRFAPHLNAVVLEGSPAERRAQAAQSGLDIVIASYAQLRRDETAFTEREWRLCVLDEAQQVKNPFSIGAQAAARINARSRFALTGTPMENHPGELWSIFNFALPGYLGDLTTFMSRHGEGRDAPRLVRRIAPFLMRRLKRDVLSDLPDKIDHLVSVELPPEQQEVYKATLLRLRKDLDARVKQSGVAGSSLRILAAITRLRQICCHPSLYIENYTGGSAKLDVLCELAQQSVEEGHRLLVFSQFTGMLKLIKTALEDMGLECLVLTGDTPTRERAELVDAYNGGKGDVFLLSLKAGGSGLNLTGADTVVHYDPWWNPAVEQQAADRAHRIGQTRAVHVMRLIARDSIEEQVVRLQEHKQALIDTLIKAGETLPAQLSPTDLYALLMEGL